MLTILGKIFRKRKVKIKSQNQRTFLLSVGWRVPPSPLQPICFDLRSKNIAETIYKDVQNDWFLELRIKILILILKMQLSHKFSKYTKLALLFMTLSCFHIFFFIIRLRIIYNISVNSDCWMAPIIPNSWKPTILTFLFIFSKSYLICPKVDIKNTHFWKTVSQWGSIHCH